MLVGMSWRSRKVYVASTVKAGGNNDVLATQSASPLDTSTSGDPTGPPTVDTPEDSARPTIVGPQLRDAERYHIMGEHGRGGLGRVSRAHDRELGRDVAIKELISRGHVNEVRFLREA